MSCNCMASESFELTLSSQFHVRDLDLTSAIGLFWSIYNFQLMFLECK